MEQYTPLLNDTKVNFSSRDSLGIESVFTSISADLCPIINTVTPRAFYWAFMCWIYYDFYKNSGIKTYTVSEFDKRYLKRQDYYFVLANLISNNSDQFNLIGKIKCQINLIQQYNSAFTGQTPCQQHLFELSAA